MKILAVSDTHGDRAILSTILARHPALAGYFYAGDSELPASDDLFTQFAAVRGNMDADSGFPLTRTVPVAAADVTATVFLTHGHRYGVNFGLGELIAAGSEVHADLVIFGHTHQLGVEQHAGMVLLNPGSISQPRGEFARLGGTYAIVTLTATLVQVEFLTRDGQLVPSLTRKFSRQ
ncbi:YfcE family phosphodiesterase [Lacticaseibacillus nasuensis]|uniref:Phosphoesterase n=1 Tax=Lacticaseibacillus nasuensis JCM 17158 TaxID=1291734 RepID=A0A0R1JGD3_9LACO|nr:metallophosphoesterase [Lacticaseibacillus nasuensis]KRK70326.1 phosphoesterase [Lacticaseibacillus nasuensis JCM 17158]